MGESSLLDIIRPEINTTILIYDVHASEFGALSILDDLYVQVKNYSDKSINWVFVVSTPEYEETDNIHVLRFPWVKKGWLHRLYFDEITTRNILRRYKPHKVFSLQNEGISFFYGKQYIYLHLAIILTDYRFNMMKDGKRLWLYQNVLSRRIFSSLRQAETIIVQTCWMKNALIRKIGLPEGRIVVDFPNVTANNIGIFENIPENRRRFFYPAAAFTYKNHMTLLKGLNYAVRNGLKDYELFLTIKADENKYARDLAEYAERHGLNVIFNGPIAREDVFRRYTNSVLVFPSYLESFGLPLLEAKMTGTLIVAADCPFSKEILGEYEKAFFFPQTDFKFLGDILREL